MSSAGASRDTQGGQWNGTFSLPWLVACSSVVCFGWLCLPTIVNWLAQSKFPSVWIITKMDEISNKRILQRQPLGQAQWQLLKASLLSALHFHWSFWLVVLAKDCHLFTSCSCSCDQSLQKDEMICIQWFTGLEVGQASCSFFIHKPLIVFSIGHAAWLCLPLVVIWMLQKFSWSVNHHHKLWKHNQLVPPETHRGVSEMAPFLCLGSWLALHLFVLAGCACQPLSTSSFKQCFSVPIIKKWRNSATKESSRDSHWAKRNGNSWRPVFFWLAFPLIILTGCACQGLSSVHIMQLLMSSIIAKRWNDVQPIPRWTGSGASKLFILHSQATDCLFHWLHTAWLCLPLVVIWMLQKISWSVNHHHKLWKRHQLVNLQRHTGGSVKWHLFFAFPRGLLFSCLFWLVVLANDCQLLVSNSVFQSQLSQKWRNSATKESSRDSHCAKRNGNSWRPVFFWLAFPLIILAGCACQGLSSVHIMQLLMSSIIAKRWNDLHPMVRWTGSGASMLFIFHSQATDCLFHWSRCLVMLAPGCHLDASKSHLGVWIITTNCENIISWCLQRHTGGSVKWHLFFAFPRGLLFSCLFWLVVLANDCQLLVSNSVFQSQLSQKWRNSATKESSRDSHCAKRNGNSWRPVFFWLAFPLIILASCACQGLSSVHIMQLLMSSIIAKRWNDHASNGSLDWKWGKQVVHFSFTSHWLSFPLVARCLVMLAPGCHLDASKSLLECELSPQNVKTSSAGASRDTKGGQWKGAFSLPWLVACCSVVCFGWLCLPTIVNCLFQTLFLSPNHHKNGGTQQQKNPPETATVPSAMGTLEGQSFSGLHVHWSFWLVVLAKDCHLFTSCSCSCPQSLQKDEMIYIQWTAGLEVGQASCSFCIHKPLIIFSIGHTAWLCLPLVVIWMLQKFSWSVNHHHKLWKRHQLVPPETHRGVSEKVPFLCLGSWPALQLFVLAGCACQWLSTACFKQCFSVPIITKMEVLSNKRILQRQPLG